MDRQGKNGAEFGKNNETESFLTHIIAHVPWQSLSNFSH
jgi:hypothetical protein